VRILGPDGGFLAEYQKKTEPRWAGCVDGQISRDDRARIGRLAARIRQENWFDRRLESDIPDGFVGVGPLGRFRVLFCYYKDSPTPVLDDAYLEIADIMMKYLRIHSPPPSLLTTQPATDQPALAQPSPIVKTPWYKRLFH
jgi:hypothetical protein